MALRYGLVSPLRELRGKSAARPDFWGDIAVSDRVDMLGSAARGKNQRDGAWQEAAGRNFGRRLSSGDGMVRSSLGSLTAAALSLVLIWPSCVPPGNAQQPTTNADCATSWASALTEMSRHSLDEFASTRPACPQAETARLSLAAQAYFPSKRDPTPVYFYSELPPPIGSAEAKMDASIRALRDDPRYIYELRFAIRGTSNHDLKTVAMGALSQAISDAAYDQAAASTSALLQAQVSLAVHLARLAGAEEREVNELLGKFMLEANQFSKARDVFETLASTSDAGPTQTLPYKLALAEVYDSLSEPEKASALYLEAFAIYQKAGAAVVRKMPNGEMIERRVLHKAADTALAKGDRIKALAAFEHLKKTYSFIGLASEILFVAAKYDDKEFAREVVSWVEQFRPKERNGLLTYSFDQLGCELGLNRVIHETGNTKDLSYCTLYPWRDFDYDMVIGRAYRRVKDWDRAERYLMSAVEKAEAVRTSLDPADRLPFFNGQMRASYEELINLNADRFAANAQSGRVNFAGTLNSIQYFRNRQFQDLAGAGRLDVTEPSIARIQKALSPGEVVVGFSALKRETLVWWIGADDFGLRSSAISRERMQQLVSRALQQLTDGSSPIESYEGALLALTRALFPTGSTQPLSGASKVQFVMDGPLTLIPPGLLSAQTDTYVPLSSTAQVSSVVDVSAILRPRRDRQWPAPLFAMADPVYADGDVYESKAPLAPARGVSAQRVRRSGTSFSLAPLPETRTEVREAGALLGSDSQFRFGADASEAELKSAKVHARYVHIATHGLLAGEAADLKEPALVLTRGSGEDGLLTMSEAQKLDLDAELTVLSACSTGAGVLLDGEGVMGMSRAFLLAGSDHVLVSLWPVDSATTVEYMALLYKALAGGATPSEANTAVANTMRGLYEHPYYWAAFTLVGKSAGAVAPPRPATVAAQLPDARGLAPDAHIPILSSSTSPAPFQAFRDCDDCPQLVSLPAGRLRMQLGDPDIGDVEYLDVSLKAFAIGRFEVTRAEWLRFAEDTGRKDKTFAQCQLYRRPPPPEIMATLPMSCTSWFDAKAYLAWLSDKTGELYRLPTDAEMEYAERAGTTTRYWWGDKSDWSRVSKDEGDMPDENPVGSLPQNPFGLFDTNGSVAEWIEDCFYSRPKADGSAAAERVSCEGSGGGSGFAGDRTNYARRATDMATGLRVVRDVHGR